MGIMNRLFIFFLILLLCNAFINSDSLRGVDKDKFRVQSDTLTQLPCFLIISDIHLNSAKNQEELIKMSIDDTRYDLWGSTMLEFYRLVKEHRPKFIIVLGDVQRH